MKKLILPISLFILIGLMGFVSACITLPKFESKNCNFSYEVHNESGVTELLNNRTAECSFNSEDIRILKDFLDSGYLIKEQTIEEYSVFLEKAKTDNQRRGCNIAHYKAVHHEGRWTGFITDYSVDESGEECAVNTCGTVLGILPNIFENDLVSDAGCHNYYWFDNTNKECSQKEFCGAFMYYGLQTFETKEECESALDVSKDECTMQGNSCCKNGDCKYLQVDCVTGTSPDFQGCDANCNPNWTCTSTINEKECSQDSDCVTRFSHCSCSAKCEKKPIDPFNVIDCARVCSPSEIDSAPISCKCENNRCIGQKINKTFQLSNGRNAEIKILPSIASQTAIEQLGELNFTVELKEVGSGYGARAAYKLTGNKEGKFLGIFKIMAKVSAQIDAETGNVISVNKPWWSFLATGI
jgi:hypothetical protein